MVVISRTNFNICLVGFSIHFPSRIYILLHTLVFWLIIYYYYSEATHFLSKIAISSGSQRDKPFFMKLGMVVHHHDPECPWKRFGCYLQGQDESSNPKKTTFFISHELLNILQTCLRFVRISWVLFLPYFSIIWISVLRKILFLLGFLTSWNCFAILADPQYNMQQEQKPRKPSYVLP